MPVLSRTRADLETGYGWEAQLVYQLIQEQGYPVVDLCFGRRWDRHARSTASDDFLAV